MIPWVLWYLWKSRNGFLFEGKRFLADEIVAKIKEEADFWFLAQAKDKEIEKNLEVGQHETGKKWSPPPADWVKCNIGFNWKQSTQKGGVAWVLRDDHGKVLVHSRRAFFSVSSKQELRTKAFEWAVESMIHHRRNKVIFAIDDGEMVELLLRPKAWPSFKAIRKEMMMKLSRMEWWRVEKATKITNRGAFLIAQSVTRFDLYQSYVANGSPDWLQHVFADEERLPSV